MGRWRDDIRRFLHINNFQIIVTNKKEWERLQGIFAYFGPRKIFNK